MHGVTDEESLGQTAMEGCRRCPDCLGRECGGRQGSLADSGLLQPVHDDRARRPARPRREAGSHLGEIGNEAPVALDEHQGLVEELVQWIFPLGPSDAGGGRERPRALYVVTEGATEHVQADEGTAPVGLLSFSGGDPSTERTGIVATPGDDANTRVEVGVLPLPALPVGPAAAHKADRHASALCPSDVGAKPAEGPWCVEGDEGCPLRAALLGYEPAELLETRDADRCHAAAGMGVTSERPMLCVGAGRLVGHPGDDQDRHPVKRLDGDDTDEALVLVGTDVDQDRPPTSSRQPFRWLLNWSRQDAGPHAEPHEITHGFPHLRLREARMSSSPQSASNAAGRVTSPERSRPSQ